MINASFDFSEINAGTVEYTAGSAAAPHGFADRLLGPFRVLGG